MEPKIEVRIIDVDEAKALIEDDVNADNRRIDWGVVNTYARQMAKGKWTFVGDPIRISTTGNLLDGQHRLNAVVKSGAPQQFVVVSGLEKEARANIDIGRKRTAADVFGMNKIHNAGTAAAVTNLVMRYEMRNVLDTKFVIQTGELLAYFQKEGNGQLIAQGTLAGEQVKRMLPVSPAVTGAIYVAASRVADAFLVNEFYNKLIDGHGLETGDAILAFRNWVIRRKREDLRTKRAEYFFTLAKTWNSWAIGEEVQRCQLPRDGLTSSDQIPTLVSARARNPEAISEDNPAVTHYSKTRRELDAGAGRQRKAS